MKDEDIFHFPDFDELYFIFHLIDQIFKSLSRIRHGIYLLFIESLSKAESFGKSQLDQRRIQKDIFYN